MPVLQKKKKGLDRATKYYLIQLWSEILESFNWVVQGSSWGCCPNICPVEQRLQVSEDLAEANRATLKVVHLRWARDWWLLIEDNSSFFISGISLGIRKAVCFAWWESRMEAVVSFMRWPQKLHCHFCILLLVYRSALFPGRNCSRALVSGSSESVGVILEAAYLRNLGC